MTVRNRQTPTSKQHHDGDQSPLVDPNAIELSNQPGRADSSAPAAPAQTQAQAKINKQEWYRYPLNLFLALSLRFLGKFGFWLHNRDESEPRAIRFSWKKSVRMRDGHEVELYVYEPRFGTGTGSGTGEGRGSTSSSLTEGPICVVNFHGGGFTIGHPTDDSRWAQTCIRAGYTFISVGYRMAPEYPYPVPVEDCLDATQYVLDHMDEFVPPDAERKRGRDKFGSSGSGRGQDQRGKVVLSGFSAGGSLAVTTALGLLNPSLSSTSLPDPSTPVPTSRHPSQYESDSDSDRSYRTRILGLVPFYPVLDWYTPRTAKLAPGVVALPGWLTRMFDTSYFPPPPTSPNSSGLGAGVDKRHPFVSPLLAPEGMLRGLPDVHLCVCEFDSLAQEGIVFGDKLGSPELQSSGREEGCRKDRGREEGGRDVVVRVVKGGKHGWDKPPMKLQKSVGVEYDAAIRSIKRWEARAVS